MAYLQLTNIHKNFGSTQVLKGVDVSLEQGEVLSIIGSSGSGKTTLLRCINFLENADEGSMVLDGETLFDCDIQEKFSDAQIREKMLNFGLVFQSFNLFPQYTVFKNITLAPLLLVEYDAKILEKELKAQGLKRKEIKSKVEEFKELKKQEILAEGESLLEKIGLTDKRENYPCELSGGQQQRVAIARALAIKPKVLCFDEPTSALDPELTGEVLKVIRSLKDEGRTMIIVTHEMGFAKNVSDKIIFMADGVVEEEGDPVQLIEKPKSEKLKAFLSSVNNKEEL